MHAAGHWEFHCWRVSQLAELFARTDEEIFSKPIDGSFGSVKEIVAHLEWAERIWMWRVGGSREERPGLMIERSLNEIMQSWQNSNDHWYGLASGHAHKPIIYKNSKGQSFQHSGKQVILHLVDHAGYHIGQIATYLRSLGVAPVPLNYINYIRA